MNVLTEEIIKQTQQTTLYGGLVTWADSEVLDNNLAIYFDVITDHSISISNNITVNYLENNTAIQDAIAHAPIECSINGMIGELVYVPSTSNGRFLNSLYKRINDKINLKAIGANKINGEYRDYVVTDKLSALGQLFPPVDNLTQLAKNTAVYIEDTIDRYKKIYKNFKRNINDKTRLQTVYETLKKLRDTNTALIVTTPFTILENMYITSLELNQGNENHMANISVSLKELNFTDIKVTAADQNVLAKYNAATQAQVENNGKADGNKTALNKITGASEALGTSGVRRTQ
jgi:hypothetical protein